MINNCKDSPFKWNLCLICSRNRKKHIPEISSSFNNPAVEVLSQKSSQKI